MKKHLSKLSFLVIGLLLAATASYLNAWSGPPAGTPPDNNISAPVNIGSSNQIKVGGLSVSSLLSSGAIGASQYCDALGQNCATPPLGAVDPLPAGAVMAFNLTTCPTGWIPSNGTNGTRDLRGYFIRGLGTNSDGTASAGFGVKQADLFRSHTHTGTTNSTGSHNHSYTSGNSQNNLNFQVGSGRWVGLIGVADNTGNSGAHTHTVSITANTDGGGTETRPNNIALLYCQKT